MGNSHSVCEDYALSGKINDHIHYVIVCDGCSSSDNVDVGARIIAHSTKEFLKMNYKSVSKINDTGNIVRIALQNYILSCAFVAGKQMGLNSNFLDSTLVVAISDGIITRSFIFGDGGVIVRNVSGAISYYRMEFNSGAPFYISYLLDKPRREAYIEEYGSEYVFEKYTETFLGVNSENTTRIHDIDYNNFPYPCYESCTDDIQSISVVSDGIHSFLDINTSFPTSASPSQDVDYMEMVDKFTAFKNFKGEFVKRRLKKIETECKRIDRTHFDDISISSIYMVENQDETVNPSQE